MAYKNIEDRRRYHNEYKLRERTLRRAEKRCVKCGQQDEDTLKGRFLCHKCEVKRIGHEPRVLIPKEKKPPIGVPRNKWYLHGWCYRCRQPLTKQVSRFTKRPIRLCDKCYEVILEIGRKRTLEAKERDSKWVN